MPPSLASRLGLGNGRAVANAHQELLRRDHEERVVAELIAALSLRGATTGAPDAGGADRSRAGSVSPAA
jgi:hypothetical protein